MAKKRKNFYAVAKGRKTGVFDNWQEVENIIKGFSGAVYKGFMFKWEAEEFLNTYKKSHASKEHDLPNTTYQSNNELKGIHVPTKKDIKNGADIRKYLLELNKLEREETIVDADMETDRLYAYVDGSYYNGTAGYGLVLVRNNRVIVKDLSSFRRVNFNAQRNVFGELRAAMKAVELSIANACNKLCIVYDYAGIEKFANGQWKGKKGCTADYAFFMDKYTKILDITFKKVKSHADNYEERSKYNEMADLLAKMSVRL